MNNDSILSHSYSADRKQHELSAFESRRENERKSRVLIENALQNRIQEIDHNTCEAGDEDAFFVADLGEVYRHHMLWKTYLARVKPHYG